MDVRIRKLLLENREIYAKLMDLSEQRKVLQNRLDMEVAVCGSVLYRNDELTPEDINPSSKIFVKLVILYAEVKGLIEIFNENLNTIKELRNHETNNDKETREKSQQA